MLLIVGAFQKAWLSLLNGEEVTEDNIERLPGMLMAAVLEAARAGERDCERLAAAGLQRLEVYESELSEAFCTRH